MKGFNLKFLEELKSKNDIVEVIGAYVPLTRRGNSFWGKCPFHHEKTASFCVNGTDQFYYCFGCHKSGDVISFIRDMESLDFADAVKFLADRAKMPMPEFDVNDADIKEQKQKRETLYAILKDAARFYAANLRSGKCPAHEDYIVKRKLSAETVNKFGIGASADYDGIVKHLADKGYSYENMVDSGVVGKTDRNGRVSYYDALAGRLIIPVIDGFNNVVAFCGRIIDNRKDVGKYVNTKETAVFSKGKTLFNINNLKKYKNANGINEVIIVEGHMDVISLVQSGIENVVASMGTALTKDQARILKRYSDKVIISYDGDFAGRKATLRGLDILRDEGLDVKVITLPDGMDPDDVIKQKGCDFYRKLIESALPLIDFKLRALRKEYDLDTLDGKRKFIVAAVKVIKTSPSVTEQEDLLRAVRDLTGTNLETLRREMANSDIEVKVPVLPSADGEMGAVDKVTLASRFILYAYIFNREYTENTDIKTLEFPQSKHKIIADYVISAKAENVRPNISGLYSVQNKEIEDERNAIAAIESGRKDDFDEEMYFHDCLKTLKTAELDNRLNELTKLYHNSDNDAEKKEISVKMNEILVQKRALQ